MQITVQKLDHNSVLVWQYHGEIVKQGDTWVKLEAKMGRDAHTDHFDFRVGDTMTEYFYADRWYNVFRVQDVDSGAVKGWYCNITRPAEISTTQDGVTVKAEDLALDVVVMPDGAIHLLDEDEFAALPLSDLERGQVWHAVGQIRALVEARSAPFDEIE